jgi:hypothetical protein
VTATIDALPELTPRTVAGLNITKPESRRDKVNILVYGESGAGKTILAGSADEVPEMRPVLLIDAEGGTLSLDKHYPNVDVVRITNFQELQDLYDELHSGRTKYRTVILDSLSELQKFGMDHIMHVSTSGLVNLMPDSIPGLKEWGINTEQIRRLVRAFRDLEMHTIITALIKEDKNQRTGQVMMRPKLSGQLSAEIPGFLDIVAYMYVKNIQVGDEIEQKRLLLTSSTDMQVAKDRTGRLPLIVEDPTMASIYGVLTQELVH